MILNCIAIDDEPPALTLLKRFIGQTPFLNLCASFTNAVDGLCFIRENPVSVIFADIEMPDLSGIELVESLSKLAEDHRPIVVFITAYDRFALDGFRLSVTDYILKPYNYRDFLRAANKCLSWYELKVRASVGSIPDEEYIILRMNHQSIRINTTDISYIEGLKDYARINLAGSDKSLLSLVTLKSLQEKLPAGKFLRIHKSFIISLSRVTSISKNAVTIGEQTLPVSLPYRAVFDLFAASWR